jgi:hypothetical protein
MVFSFYKHIALSLDVLNLVFLVHFIFLHFFHGHHFSGETIAADSHFSKCASSDNRERFKVLDRDLLTPEDVKSD